MATRRRKLRRRLTPAEATLWNALKNSKLQGRKFRRQHSIGNYIVDFYCVEEWLAVELDGEVHKNEAAIAYDHKRKLILNDAGVKVIRFENFLVFKDIDYVAHRIESFFGWRENSRTTTPSVPSKSDGTATPPNQEGSP
jgi:very-short-patch-repair endonuclease